MVATLITFLTMVSAADSCPVSTKTVIKVERCPKTEKEWMERAKRKNCETYASLCDEPVKLKYHCVINAFVGLIEVCAYEQAIVNGHCTEYSKSGNLIQGSQNITCYNFTNNYCPLYYPSTEAYKYPECYEHIKKMIQEAAQNSEESSSPLVQTTASNILHEKKENKCGINIANVPVIVLSVVIARKILP
uniref:Uncharacterized protein LOC111099852 isoform X2 n=1 Tax=Crassostrea virginica TaxID=6565 RepID=A0A8B8A6D8_CRAVI|nr:uncharacterized protein LOC111099852 isoform X2 [Crassostrea virginica]